MYLAKIICIFLFTIPSLFAQTQTYSLESTDNLQLINLKAESATFKDKSALKITNNPAADAGKNYETLAIISDSQFKNGTIELELAGLPDPKAGKFARGFIGLAFRMQDDAARHYECFYIRPTNGRADNQVRRNHSTQYVSHPEYPWHRLRKESPGMYESYADVVPGKWTQVKIVVSGTKALLFLDDAEQPCLIVNDLKMGETSGKIALWQHASTVGYFRNLKIRSE